MKKINKYILIISMFSLFIVLNSCENLLTDQKPVSSLTVSNAYETELDLHAGLQGVYNRVMNALNGGRYSDYGDARGGRTYWGDYGIYMGSDECFEGNFSSTTGLADWGVFYKPINMINTLLELSETIPFKEESEKTIFIGELYFLRAFCYFNLLRLWGEVPIIDFSYNSSDQDFYPSQGSKADVAAFIAEDIKNASTSLANAPYNVYRATLGSTNALKVHFYAWKGRVLDGGSPDYQLAADAALAVINDVKGGYKLLSNYADIFYKGYGSKESIFELLAEPVVRTTSLEEWAKVPYRPSQLRAYLEFAEEHLVYFENTPEDKRIDVLKNESMPGDLVQAPYVSKWLGSAAEPDPTTAGASNQADNFIIYRLADIILLRAEMLNLLGQTQTAIDLLNQVRSRAGLGGTTAGTQEEVDEALFQERRLELLAEGQLWYDIVRFGKALDMSEIDSPDEIYLPVHQNELDINPNLHQNPFYK